ncbi:type II secretion system F family protein [Microbacterium sp.]|uniref:type II secretion system F family protein n=1 Tax=Microbacterium sp. TaxID=51671 RepID=UPI0039E442BE
MSPVTLAAFAAVLGGAFASGVLLTAARIPRWSAPTLSRRIAPYLRDVADPLGLTPLAPLASPSGWSLRGVRRLVPGGWLAWAAGPRGGALEQRLRQAAWTQDAVGFRARQLAWALIAVAVGGGLAVALTLAGRGGPVTVALPPLLAVVAIVAYDYRLSAAARRRSTRVEEELPTVLEFLALCLAAGEGLRDALRRVGEVGSGVLTAELRGAVLASGTGSNLPDALLAVAKGLDVPALSRAIEHLVAAMDRGAPLAHVLQQQAVDAREDAKRTLIEAAGRKEIYMLLPHNMGFPPCDGRATASPAWRLARPDGPPLT